MKKTLLIILSLMGLSFAFADDAALTGEATTETGTTTVVETTTGATVSYADADKNKDGKVDDVENCLFVQNKTMKECSKYFSGVMLSGDRPHFGSGMMFSGVKQRIGSGVMFSGDRPHFGSGMMFSGMKEYMGSGVIFSGDRPHFGSGMVMMSGVRANIHENKQEIGVNWEIFHSEWGFIGDYLKSDITTGERAEVRTLIEAHAKEVRTTIADQRKRIQDQIKSGSGSVDWTGVTAELQASLKTIQDKYVEAILPYVDSAKQEDFKKFIEAREATVQANVEYRKDIAKEKKKIYKYLSEKIRTSFVAKIENLSDEQIQKIIAKVDAKIEATKTSSLSQSKKIKTIAILNEIKSVLEDQLGSSDELDQQAIVDEITAE